MVVQVVAEQLYVRDGSRGIDGGEVLREKNKSNITGVFCVA